MRLLAGAVLGLTLARLLERRYRQPEPSYPLLVRSAARMLLAVQEHADEVPMDVVHSACDFQAVLFEHHKTS